MADPPEEFTSETYLIEVTEHCTDNILSYLVTCLRSRGLNVEVVQCHDKKVISVTCPFHLLCQQAEELQLLKRTNEPIGVRKFTTHNSAVFVGHESQSGLFTPAEQMLILEYVLQQVSFSPEEFEKVGVKKIGAKTSFLTACLHSKPKLIETHTPQHSAEDRKKLWQSIKRNPFVFPYHDISNYYGPEVAFYFAWMSFFTYALFPIAGFGIVLFLHRQFDTSITVDDSPYLPFYALGMALWAIIYLKGWTRMEHCLALEWGTYRNEQVENVRPEFEGELRLSPITGKMETYYPMWRRRVRYFLSFLISLPFLMLGVGAMILSLNLNGYIKHPESPIHIASLARYADPGGIFAGDNPYYGWMVPTIAPSIVINIINQIYRSVAAVSTDIENHKTESAWSSSLIVKRVMFELFDCYLPLFYIAFYQLDILALRRELVGLFWGDEIRRVVTEAIIPYITEKIEARKVKKASGLSKKSDDPSKLKELAIINNLIYEEYEQFDDYIEMVVQFGYVTLFASAFPLCSAVTILFLFLEARSDMFKLLFLTRRPVVRRAKSIGM